MKAKKLFTAVCGGMLGSFIIVGAYIESRHEIVLPKDKIVRIFSERGMCSGEQVHSPSGVDYILTAGHCRGLSDKSDVFSIKTEDGRILQRKLIAEDPNSDLLLIEGLPKTEGINIADRSYSSENITTLTHGNNFDTYMTKGVLIQMERVLAPVTAVSSEEDKAKCSSMPKNLVQEGMFGEAYCCLNVMEVVSTALIVPGSSGGAVLDSSMSLVGVVSAGDGKFGAFVSLKDIKAFLSNY